MSHVDPTTPTADTTTPARAGLVRAVAVLALLLALLAVPGLGPQDASARPMSDSAALRACLRAGGASYDVANDYAYSEMMCVLPSGNFFNCYSVAGTFGWIVDCY